jgi:hemoglobin-like flavoprotein
LAAPPVISRQGARTASLPAQKTGIEIASLDKPGKADIEPAEAFMTAEERKLVQTSFARIAPIADVAAKLFYEELFARDPRLRSLFTADMAEQRQKLMAMLATAVNHLNDWSAVQAALHQLGRRHASYGVKPEDYATVGAALIATLETGLGAAFTPDVRNAWQSCIALVATEMQARLADDDAKQAVPV